MKKLLTVVAFAASVICANAASVNWNVVNVQSPTSGTIASAGWLVEVYSAATTYSYDAAKAGTISAVSSGATFASGTIMRVTGSVAGYSANDAVELYAVIYDADSIAGANHYIVSDVPTGKKIAASGADLALAFGNMAATTTANMFRNSTWTAVPEPTSGLLMLLGMAGLALRRRRA